MPTYETSSFYVEAGVGGIWNSYGCPVEDGQGLSIFVQDNSEENESLIDLVGFDRTHKNIGKLKDSKTISELVVMLPMVSKDIPYVEVPTEVVPYTPPDPCQPCEDKVDTCGDIPNNIKTPQTPKDISDANKLAGYDAVVYNFVENAWLFVIREDIINKILDVEDYKKLSIHAMKEILDTRKELNHDNTIVKLMRAMVKYNFPPHLNWMLFPNRIPPYSMYIAEFSSTLNKHDLSNIWQGTMPKLAQEPEEQEIIIEHFLTDEEVFGNIDITNLEDLKLSIFKCKLRASNSYINSLKQTTFAERKTWYNYNWPYDNFSLVELLKVEAGEVHQYIEPKDLASTVVVRSDGVTEYTINKDDYNTIDGQLANIINKPMFGFSEAVTPYYFSGSV